MNALLPIIHHPKYDPAEVLFFNLKTAHLALSGPTLLLRCRMSHAIAAVTQSAKGVVRSVETGEAAVRVTDAAKAALGVPMMTHAAVMVTVVAKTGTSYLVSGNADVTVTDAINGRAGMGLRLMSHAAVTMTTDVKGKMETELSGLMAAIVIGAACVLIDWGIGRTGEMSLEHSSAACKAGTLLHTNKICVSPKLVA